MGPRTECHDTPQRGSIVSAGPLDTATDVAVRYEQMLLARSASDRVMMAMEAFDFARALALASLPEGADEAARRIHLFKRIYEQDFDAQTAARIIARLQASDPNT